MDGELIYALLSLVGSVVGTMAGIMTANKLTSYRIEQLEKKVDKHNGVIERVAVNERDMKTAFKRIDENRDDIKHILEK